MNWIYRIAPLVNTVGNSWWKKGRVEPRRYIFDHELLFFFGGACAIRFGETEYICHDMSWIIIPPGILHESVAISEKVYRFWIHFDWIAPEVEDIERSLFVYHPAKVDERFFRRTPDFIPVDDYGVIQGHLKASEADLIRDLTGIADTRWNHSSEFERGTCRAILLEILIRLFPDSGDSSRPLVTKSRELALKVKEILDTLPPQGVNITKLLERCGRTYPHLCRVFREEFGMPPVEYMNMLRISEARHMLESEFMSIEDVALRAGFESPAYFSKKFREAMNMTPRQYAEAAYRRMKESGIRGK